MHGLRTKPTASECRRCGAAYMRTSNFGLHCVRCRKLPRCAICHAIHERAAAFCHDCSAVIQHIAAIHGRPKHQWKLDPQREQRIRKYTARAEAGLPLFSDTGADQ